MTDGPAPRSFGSVSGLAGNEVQGIRRAGELLAHQAGQGTNELRGLCSPRPFEPANAKKATS
jgi:hypothetical protein